MLEILYPYLYVLSYISFTLCIIFFVIWMFLTALDSKSPSHQGRCGDASLYAIAIGFGLLTVSVVTTLPILDLLTRDYGTCPIPDIDIGTCPIPSEFCLKVYECLDQRGLHQ